MTWAYVLDNYSEIIKIAAQQGAWAVAAVAIFVILLRYMAKREADDKGREELLVDIVTNNTAAMSKNTSSNEAVAIAVSELRRDIQNLRDHKDRR